MKIPDDLSAQRTDGYLPQHQVVFIFMHGTHDNKHRWSRMFDESDMRSLHRLHTVIPNADKRRCLNLQLLSHSDERKRSFLSVGFCRIDPPRSNDSITAFGVKHEFDEQVGRLCDLIERYSKLTDNIFLGGFSHGVVMAVCAAARTTVPICGLVLLGSVPLNDHRQQNVADFATFQTITHEENRDKISSQPTLPKFTNNPVNKDLPIFLGIGVDDGIQTEDEENMTLKYLKSMFGGNPHFVRHGPNLGHTTNKQQLDDVASFIVANCPTVIQSKL